MRNRWCPVVLVALAAILCSNGCVLGAQLAKVTPDMVERIRAAAPKKPVVPPAKPRKMLVFNLCKGFTHASISVVAKAMEVLGETTGAFTIETSTDPAAFRADNLARFDAVCFNNCTGALFNDPDLKKSLMDWVRAGHGVVGIHAATDVGAWKWPEFHEMMGGVFSGHPWHETVGIKIDDPQHPIARVLGGEGFVVRDEIYQFNKGIYSRNKLRVLLSLDMSCTAPKGKRDDGDYAVAWIRPWGKGRVFYCSLGHENAIMWNPKVLAFDLAGIQYALGDLKADDTPSAQLNPQPKPALVPASAKSAIKPATKGKGKKKAAADNVRLTIYAAPPDASGWLSLFDGKRSTLEKYWDNGRGSPPSENWVIEGDALVRKGKAGYLWTKQRFGNFELQLDFKTEGNSGLFFRTGDPKNPVQTGFEMQILNSGGKKNPDRHDCGAVYDALAPSANPVKNDDWNHVVLTCRDNKIQIAINGTQIIDMDVDKWDAPGKNPDGSKNKYKKALKDFPREGHIGLQEHGSKVMFRNIRVRPLDAK